MRLWTWQNRAFDLDDRTQPVRSLEHSSYITDPRLAHGYNRERHKRGYEKIFQRLGTDQIIWCYHEWAEAVSKSSLSEYGCRDCLLWEIDVPPAKIRWYCDLVWNYMRKGKLEHPIYEESRFLRPQDGEQFTKDLITYWENKDEGELLDLLFLNGFANGCSGAIAYYPVDTVVKNPLLLGKWWRANPSRANHRTIQQGPVPLLCPNCPGKRTQEEVETPIETSKLPAD